MPKAKTKSVSRRRASSDSSSDDAPPAPAQRKKNTRVADQNGDSDSDSSVGQSIVSSVSTSAASSAFHAGTSTAAVDRVFSQLSIEDRERLANNIVRYLLIADQRKIPIKRADIIKHTLKDNGRAFSPMMKLAADKLRTVYGIELVEVELGKHKVYILVNALDNKYDEPHQTWPPEDNIRMGLVMVVLSVIFMKGNVLNEDDLYDMLRRLGVSIDRPDETFGDVKRLLMSDLVRQGYLDVEREAGEPPVHYFRWGPRAKAETSKRNAIDFICQVFGEDSPQRWIAQMQDIEQSEANEDVQDAAALVNGDRAH